MQHDLFISSYLDGKGCTISLSEPLPLQPWLFSYSPKDVILAQRSKLGAMIITAQQQGDIHASN